MSVTIDGKVISCALSDTLSGMSAVEHKQPRKDQTRTVFTNAEIEWARFQKETRDRILEVSR